MIKPRLKPRRVIGNIAEYFEIKNNYGAISELGKSIKKDQTYFYAQMRIGTSRTLHFNRERKPRLHHFLHNIRNK